MKSDYDRFDYRTLLDPYEILKQAYVDWQLTHQDTPADAEHLAESSFSLYLIRRDWLLEYWTERTAQQAPAYRLRRLADRVLELLWRTDERAAIDFATADLDNDDTLPVLVANGLAVLRWHNHCRVGRVYDTFPLSLTEVRVWIYKHNFPVRAGQLSLFLDR